MKIPVVYELNGRRLCLLVQDGETISIGRAEGSSIRVEGDAVQEVELTAQFVNSCQFVVVTPAHGGVPYAQPLPWKLPLTGVELELFRPATGAKDVGREIVLQGVSAGETRLLMKPGLPLLLGSGPECDVVIPDEGCPHTLLGLWTAAGSKVLVQILDNTGVVGWLGRAGETEAELDLPLSLSLGGRVILISTVDAPAVKSQGPVAKVAAPAFAPLAKAPGIQAKNAEYGPKIVSRQAKPADSKEDAGPQVRTAEPSARPIVQAATYASSPLPLPKPTGVAAKDDLPLLAEPVVADSKPYSPTVFLLASWLMVALTFAVALLPGREILPPDQILLLWKATGGTLILTLVLGLVVLLK